MKITVRKGDTFSYYSQLFGLPLQLLLDSNLQTDPEYLLPGSSLLIPGYFHHEHTVKKGDTFHSLSRRYNVSLDGLFILNQENNAQLLEEGMVVNVPERAVHRVVSVGVPYDYTVLKYDLQRLCSLYPFIRSDCFGQSVLKKDLVQLKCGRGPKKVHVNASFHANEWITTGILMVFLNDYLLALTNNTPIRGINMLPLYESATLSAVPMVDPDGVDLVLQGPPDIEPYRSLVKTLNKQHPNFKDWKANIRGVDLNNQLPARWEIEKARKPAEPAPRDYPGDYPLSEPEAKAIANLTVDENFDRVIALHTQGKEFYWGFEKEEPDEAEKIAEEFERVSGYKAVRYVDSYAGYKDWFIQEFRKPGFTIELGIGVNPLPLSQFQEIYKDTLGIFLASLYM
ncbi:LysM peptidoglycan-binding domain-containing protein [Fictibacillus sp. KIGAM418]|uniref:LysM peptidoglycan-binding domain-containing protein n=1 Tax=Fictibacillus marinisediminis TaxID=2878389 RepID=A0A9X1XB71_9BACL|nr:M14 family zinc carboxypeptidase [Fictibacillus marinisediminis]MCK6257692.1 LysM peptidoglycan-binding domain-containing protein [Fictibacillus marinisediminis]